MALVQKTTLVAEAQARVIEALASGVYFAGWLKSYVLQGQALEDMLFGVLDSKALDLATGDALDALGAIVGQPREGRDDDTYRTWIRARIHVNRSSGTIPDIDTVLALIYTGAWTLEQNPPASLHITLDTITTAADAEQVFLIISSMIAAGVGLTISYFTTAPVARFDTIGAGWDTGYWAGSFSTN